MVVDMCVRYDTGIGQYTSMVVDMCVLRGMTQVGQYTSMVVDMCVLRGTTQVNLYSRFHSFQCYYTDRKITTILTVISPVSVQLQDFCLSDHTCGA